MFINKDKYKSFSEILEKVLLMNKLYCFMFQKKT
jgi:hypothetical protein